MRRLHAAMLPLWAALSCVSRTAPPESTLTVGRASDVIALDPARVTDTESSEVCDQIFERLVRYKRGSTEVEPALASSWTTSPDGMTWTFTLRRGVRFHDGTPLDADAVVFSFDRQRDPKHPSHETDFAYWPNTYRNIQRIERVDAHTVRIVIDRPYAPLLSNLAMFPVSIVSPTAVRRLGHDFARYPVGTGPFRFVEWVVGDRVTLEANLDHWEGPPKIGHLVYRVVAGDRDRLVALESGSIDVAYSLAPSDLAYVRLHPDLKVIRAPAHNVAYLAMNMNRPPLDDVRVRRAVNHAINKPLIVKLLYQSMAIAAHGPIPPAMWGYDPSLPRYAFDQERARALLREVRFDTAIRPRLFVMTTPRPYMPAPEHVARVIARNLHEVGIEVEIHPQPLDRLLESTARGEHDFALRGWSSDNGDPDNFLFQLLDPTSVGNVAFYRNARVHDLLVSAQALPDRAAREPLYLRAQHIIAEEAPWVPLVHADLAIGARTNLQGLEVHPTSVVLYRGVWRDPSAAISPSRATSTGR